MKLVISKKVSSGFLSLCCSLAALLALVIITVTSTKSSAPVSAPADCKIIRSDETIIIDAGHGGADGGTAAEDGTLEKNINLQISKTLDSMLRAMGYKTVMVRTTDVSVYDKGTKTIKQQKISDLKNRLRLTEKYENAILISIHQNYYQSPSASGTQVFFSPNNSGSELLAGSIMESVRSHLQPENRREIKKSGSEIYLLNNTKIPAVMVECGFMSNERENNLLCNDYYQRQLSFCIACGLANYLQSTKDV